VGVFHADEWGAGQTRKSYDWLGRLSADMSIQRASSWLRKFSTAVTPGVRGGRFLISRLGECWIRARVRRLDVGSAVELTHNFVWAMILNLERG